MRAGVSGGAMLACPATPPTFTGHLHLCVLGRLRQQLEDAAAREEGLTQQLHAAHDAFLVLKRETNGLQAQQIEATEQLRSTHLHAAAAVVQLRAGLQQEPGSCQDLLEQVMVKLNPPAPLCIRMRVLAITSRA